MSQPERTCTSCNAIVPPEADFCMKCGVPTHGTPAQPPSDPLRDGLIKALGTQYEVQRLLGRGGMGAVYLARETALDRLVAVKVLPPDASDDQSRERFRREARTAAKLTHPNIVPLYSFGEAEGMMYFVMGYVRGESLSERLKRDGKVKPEATRKILGELADALDYAHKQGVVHRDIKPDNVLIDDESGRPMLTDFGVAKARASGTTLTEMGAVVGTPHYMSPEQASGDRDLDGRSDLYSLGVVGYTMLIGRPPFEGESFRDVIVQHVTKKPEPLNTIEPSIPSDLAGAIERCLAKEPEARWADGNRLKQSIWDMSDDGDIDAPPAGKQNFDGLAAKLIPVTAGLGAFAWLSYLFPSLGDGEAPWWALPTAMGVMVFGMIGVFAGYLRLKGTGWNELARLFLRQPRSWPFWYPRRWRRDGDVWDRLPPIVKRCKWSAAAAWLLAVPMFVLTILHYRAWFHYPIAPVGAAFWGSMIALAGFLGVPGSAVMMIRTWARKKGLDPAMTVKIAYAPTGDLRLWRKDKYQEILLPPVDTALVKQVPAPETPKELLKSLVGAAGELTGPAGEVGADAVSGARQLVVSLDALDKEIEVLARDGESADVAGIEAKLQALGAESDGDSEERRQMRQLLSSQLDLARRLSEQLAAAKERRERLLGLLKTLWLQVADLRARSAQEAFTGNEISGKIRAICEDVEHQVAATDETVRALTPSDGDG